MSETETMLREVADRLFSEQCDHELRARADRGEWPDRLWQAVVEAGLTTAGIAEELGGAGVSMLEAMTVVRAAGRHAIPVPLVESILSNWLLSTIGQSPLTDILSVSVAAESGPLQLRRISKDWWTLAGTVHLVPWGAYANHVVVVAQTEEGTAVVLQVPSANFAISHGNSLAGEPRDKVVLGEVAFADSTVEAARPGEGIQGFLALGALCRCEQMVGAMEWVLERTLAYAGEREQFGKLIGGFQAVQHLIAVMAGHVHAAACATDAARITLMTASAQQAIGYAKARVGEAAGEVAAIAHQVHGAMGYSHEYPLHYRTRRLWNWREEFGSERYWQMRVGRSVSARGSASFWPDLTDVHA